MKLLFVVGARPNFMKVAPIIHAVRKRDPSIQQFLVHTGQHFDTKMSDIFFEELELPAPDEHLGVSGGSHAEQTARIMLAFEPILLRLKPDWLVVVGDVNSTAACSLVASKLRIRIAHVEAGLRSGDMTMPEEVNRRVTDAISSLLLTPSRDGDENLLREGADPSRIHFVGNVMIDSLIKMLPLAERRSILRQFDLEREEYVLATLHRPSNVDCLETLQGLIRALVRISEDRTVLFPVHPRTRNKLHQLGVVIPETLRLMEPLGYLDFLCLMRRGKAVVTDSGGVQEETTYLGVPCLTVRLNTERPITITEGTNQLVAPNESALVESWKNVRGSNGQDRRIPELWDGHAAERVTDVILA